MENILLLDTSVASGNKGDDIIMECVRDELQFILNNNFEYTLPTHVSPFHWYQVWRSSSRLRTYSNCRYKFIGGSNILCKNMLTHYPQWNINWFNCKPLVGSIGVGVGAGAGEESNRYTRMLYRRILSHDYLHSARDERTKRYIESLGLKAINTGCVSMWMLTPEFCRTIPTCKSDKVVFTLTANANSLAFNQFILDTLIKEYGEVYFWPQGMFDYQHFQNLSNRERVVILSPDKKSYNDYLTNNDTDYVGTRLHGGIYAMRHGRRSIIIAIDERAREINKSNNLICIDREEIEELPGLINSKIETCVSMNYDNISLWKSQFKDYYANGLWNQFV